MTFILIHFRTCSHSILRGLFFTTPTKSRSVAVDRASTCDEAPAVVRVESLLLQSSKDPRHLLSFNKCNNDLAISIMLSSDDVPEQISRLSC